MRYDVLLEAIAALQTQPDLRARLLLDPDKTWPILIQPPLGLEPDELASLSSLPASMLRVLDATALFHRWTRLQEHLTWLDPHLRPELAPLLQRFLAKQEPHLLNRADALAFCTFVEALADSDPAGVLPPAPLGPFLKELCGLERRSIQLAWGLEPLPEIVSFSATYPLLAIKTRITELPGGWPELTPKPVRITLTKVPWLPGVLVNERCTLPTGAEGVSACEPDP